MVKLPNAIPIQTVWTINAAFVVVIPIFSTKKGIKNQCLSRCQNRTKSFPKMIPKPTHIIHNSSQLIPNHPQFIPEPSQNHPKISPNFHCIGFFILRRKEFVNIIPAAFEQKLYTLLSVFAISDFFPNTLQLDIISSENRILQKNVSYFSI